MNFPAGFRVASVDGVPERVPAGLIVARSGLLSLLPGWINVHIRPARCLQHGAPSPLSTLNPKLLSRIS